VPSEREPLFKFSLAQFELRVHRERFDDVTESGKDTG
jgi:hypothetical protein